MSGTNTVHLDLAGHRIKGNGTGTGINYPPGVAAGNLEVTNGTITGFAAALIGPSEDLPILSNLALTRMNITGNDNWMPDFVRHNVLVEDSSIIDSGDGGAGTDWGQITVRNSKFIRSRIYSISESYNYIYDSIFIGTGAGITSGNDSLVIATGNVFRDCDTGIYLADPMVYVPSRIKDNKFIRCRTGADFPWLSGPISVQRNLFSKNTVAGLTFSIRPGLDGDISGNTFVNNDGDGLTGTVGDPGTPSAAVVRVTGNLAVRNAGYGINVSAVTDGGLNRARGNGAAQQCVGVVCTRP